LYDSFKAMKGEALLEKYEEMSERSGIPAAVLKEAMEYKLDPANNPEDAFFVKWCEEHPDDFDDDPDDDPEAQSPAPPVQPPAPPKPREPPSRPPVRSAREAVAELHVQGCSLKEIIEPWNAHERVAGPVKPRPSLPELPPHMRQANGDGH